MVKVKDINYVSFLSIVKKINFDDIEKNDIGYGKKQTVFVYNDLTNNDYFTYIADYNKSDVSMFINKLKELKTIVHLDTNY